MTRYGFWLVGLLILLTAGTLVVAQSPERPREKNTSAEEGRRRSAGPLAEWQMTRQREKAALEFAREHHSELAELLAQLRRGDRPQYQKAVRELFQTRERLERLRERQPERYELSLDEWKLDSRIRLLAARMTMSDDAAIEEELTEALRQRVDLRLEILKLDRERTAARLEKLNAAIAEIESSPDAAALKDLQRLKKSLPLETSNKSRRERPSKPVPQKTDPKTERSSPTRRDRGTSADEDEI
ncbi:MAG: hypothetical protein ACREJB_08205 [Planctomycetaceae bacterium]